MIFSTPIFLLFFVSVFLVYWYALPSLLGEKRLPRARHIFLLIVSYIFYTYSVWQYGLLIALSTLIDYVAGLILAKADVSNSKKEYVRKVALGVSLCMNLGILGYFKYSDFFISNFLDFLIRIGATEYTVESRQMMLLNLILPVGISFFTFQSMSYTIDVYRRVIPAEKDFIRFALFISFFPQLVAGPIVTAKEFLPQLDIIPKFKIEDMRIGLRYFLLGYFKKVVLADNMAPIVNQIYHTPEAFGPKAHWVGAVATWILVYGDFSGYSDMAIGTARFLGFRLPENFRIPLLSRSITEQWQRWHISLIRWNRDYVYIPLGGSKVSYFRHKYNVFITMFLAGVWHGANWTYVIWGAIHGLILVIESAWKGAKLSNLKKNIGAEAFELHKIEEREMMKSGSWLQRKGATYLFTSIVTFFITIFFGTIFISQNISDSVLVMASMLGLASPAVFAFTNHVQPTTLLPATNAILHPVIWSMLTVFIGSVIGWFIFEKKKFQKDIPIWLEFTILPFLTLIAIQLSHTGVQAFIYFQF